MSDLEQAISRLRETDAELADMANLVIRLEAENDPDNLYVKRARAYLQTLQDVATLLAGMGWQDMESAPHDEVIQLNFEEGGSSVGAWTEKGWRYTDLVSLTQPERFKPPYGNPTGWKALPSGKPKEEEK